MASFSSLFQDQGPRSRCNSTASIRSESVKRRNNDPPIHAAKNSRLDTTAHFASIQAISGESMALLESNLLKVQAACEKLKSDIDSLHGNNDIAGILSELCASISTTNSIQVEIVAALNSLNGLSGNTSSCPATSRGKEDDPSTSGDDLSGPAPARPPGSNRSHLRQAPLGEQPWTLVGPSQSKNASHSKTPVVETTEQVRAELRFKDAIRESEKAILLHNLNMGNAPMLNPDSMNTKVTADLISKAAETESSRTGNNNTGRPSQGIIDSLDDLISVATNMEFFGKVTKPCKIPGKNATFYTIPVKLKFKDRDTRMRAENILRDLCQVSISTPYPFILRECIKRTTSHYKDKYPDSFIKVNVEPNSQSLRVSMRPGPKEEKNDWVVIERHVPLPPAAMDVAARKLPDDFEISFPSKSGTSLESRMEVQDSSHLGSTAAGGGGEGGGSGERY
jgi:hypothetical protein